MEYAELINRILEVEQTALEITRDAREKQAQLDAELKRESDELRANYFAQADRRLERVKQEAEAERDAAIAAQTARFDEARARMERAYSRYGDNWVDTLFRQTVEQRQ